MNLLDLRLAHPHLFYAQDWFLGESFMRALAGPPVETPTRILHGGRVPAADAALPVAIDLAEAFIRDPYAAIWRRFLWCADHDHLGQRIYVGGVSAENGHRFEIHRHLAITEKWGCPSW